MAAAEISANPSSSASRFPVLFPRAVGYVLLGGTIIGLAPILVRVSEAGPLATAGWRMGLAALALFPFWLMQIRADEGKVRGELWPVLLAGLFFTFDVGLYHISLTLTSIAHATLIVNLAPLVALAAGYFLFGERFRRVMLAGLVLSLGGAVAMTAGRAGVAGTLIGNAFAFTGMIGYASYLIAVKQARQTSSVLTVVTLSSAVSAVLLFGAANLRGEAILAHSIEGWLVLIALGVAVHALGQGLVAIGMRETPVGLASILLLMQPVCAGICAWLIFGETLGPVEMAGAAAVLLGIGLAAKSG
jgi:drug/metabolite transporter (DMT)-like permease